MSKEHFSQFIKQVSEHENLQRQINTTSPTSTRYYNLDALRAFAMLLGIGLHAAIPFVPYIRPSDGESGAGILLLFSGFVHGFRMPLFFLLSGFFTTMLWRRRGLRFLIEHRLKRIALPLMLGVITILPATVIGLVGGLALTGVDLDNFDDAKAANDPDTFEFGHMWFLWFLLWIVAGFTFIVSITSWLSRKGILNKTLSTRFLTGLPWSLPVVTLITQWMMVERQFGPDTSAGLIPAGHVLIYYASFFGFGALAYGRKIRQGLTLIDFISHRWILLLTLSTVVLFGPGLALIATSWIAASALQATFAWTMSFGLIGLFRRFMSNERSWVRYLSDASYWMYLAHLPLVFIAQGLIARWNIHAIPKFLLICFSVTAVLLVTYEYLVRYRSLGTLLNGKRVRVIQSPT